MDASVDTKAAVIRQDLADARLAGRRVLMVGDRRTTCRARPPRPARRRVLYGYGSRAELEACRPLFLAEDCEELTPPYPARGHGAIETNGGIPKL